MRVLTDPRGYWDDLTTTEQGVTVAIGLIVFGLVIALLTGALGASYFLFLFGLAGMYALLSFGLNSQWGFTGLINFSVAAFFGLGAYGAALMTASNSPIGGGYNPVFGLIVGLALAAVVAVAIGIPTLRLRADYLAIATLGLAEVIRLFMLNERQWTNGSAGLRGIPTFFEEWPVLGTFTEVMPAIEIELVPGSPVILGLTFWQQLLNVVLLLVFLGGTFAVLRRAQRSPWGRLLRTIRSDEDLAKALGKNTYSYKMQSFVLGSLIMALAGVFYAHLNLFVSPGDLDPITTFYVWVAVILGGSGSNRGALLGGFVVVAIREGSRFVNDIGWIPLGGAPFRLLAIGLLIILVMRFRPQGILPPQRELIWPSAVDSSAPSQPDRGVRDVKAGEKNE
ncbi:branched-chain amino acid ABC transporter permease [Natronorubrum bangense]|uniref:Branched-chain amino acid ABC transporter permease n=2 Tax=Natronorubrum bangense TaxID=61858 RepID=A0A4D6HH42_9EURY|nr:branched-chain amino acid ABC transporter permease [Natronorubrum bangense]ELY43183.1 inner-membrane translocator [Natronorubrum bangense JCM 10635]QCC53279.1 branched-chain amino acid ABC transporter permease [Natronorubrum bangense]QCC56027.1 branched-chain amino acid ABC transporter permease [Natronorubrum bangense]